MDESRHTFRRHKSRRHPHDLFRVRRLFYNLQSASRRRTALTGFILGLVLGCLVGGIMTLLPRGANAPAATLDVNEATGKTQIHLQGKPNIK